MIFPSNSSKPSFSSTHPLDLRQLINDSCCWSYRNFSSGKSDNTTSTFVATSVAAWRTVGLGLLAGLVSLVTIGGNLVVLMSFFLERSIRQPTHYFIASLAVSDLLIGALSMPFYSVYLLAGKKWPLGEMVCDLWLSVDYTVCLCSIYTVLCITVDRYCSVKIPAKYRSWRTERKVVVMVMLVWLIPAVVFFTTIFGWQHFVGRRTVAEDECYVQYMDNAVFNCVLQVAYFWLTLVVICVLYSGIYRVALGLQQKSEAKQKKMESLVSPFSRGMNNLSRTLAKKSRLIRFRKQKIDQMIEKEDEEEEEEKEEEKEEEEKENREIGAETSEALLNSTEFCNSISGVDDLIEEYQTAILTSIHSSPLRNLEDERSSSPALPSDTEQSSYHSSTQAPPDRGRSSAEARQRKHLTKAKTARIRSKILQLHYPPSERVRRKLSQAFFNIHIGGVAGAAEAPVLDVGSTFLKDRNNWNEQNSTDQIDDGKKVMMRWNKRRAEYHDSVESEEEENVKNSLKTTHKDISHATGNISGVTEATKDALNDIDEKEILNIARKSQSRGPIDHNVSAFKANMFPSNGRCNFTKRGDLEDAFSFSTNQNSSNTQKNIPVAPTETQNVVESKESRTHPQSSTPSGILYASEASIGFDASSAEDTSKVKDNSQDSKRLCRRSPDESEENRRIAKVEYPSGLSLRRQNEAMICDRQRKRPEEGLVSPSSSSLSSSARSRNATSRRKSKSENRARKALRTITIILGVFIVCWTPWHILSLVLGFWPPDGGPLSLLYDVSYWLCYLNSPINPLCYALANQQFKQAFTRIMKLDWRRT